MSGVDARAPWVELRVHGVSGTPPADLLDRPRVKQVDGDVRSRFFRATDGDHHVLARRAPSPQPCVAGPTSSGTSWCSGRTRSTVHPGAVLAARAISPSPSATITPTPGTGRDVVVCAHSQGSLITFAELNLLTDEEIKRVGMVTFGSQLRVIFPRSHADLAAGVRALEAVRI